MKLVSYELLIENYINGNLADFYNAYRKLRNTAKFWLYVKEIYGEETAKQAKTYLIKKGAKL